MDKSSNGLKIFSISEATANIPRHKRKTSINISRKGSIVKEKCRQLTEIASGLVADGIISDPDLTDLIEDHCGADKETVRAYKGYRGSIRQRKGSNEGYIFGQSRKGYLEKFGFMYRVNRSLWKISQTVLLSSSSLQTNGYERLTENESIKRSLSFSQGETSEGNRFQKVPLEGEATEENISIIITTEREKSLHRANT